MNMRGAAARWLAARLSAYLPQVRTARRTRDRVDSERVVEEWSAIPIEWNSPFPREPNRTRGRARSAAASCP